jgi:hypothetical protein
MFNHPFSQVHFLPGVFGYQLAPLMAMLSQLASGRNSLSCCAIGKYVGLCKWSREVEKGMSCASKHPFTFDRYQDKGECEYEGG